MIPNDSVSDSMSHTLIAPAMKQPSGLNTMQQKPIAVSSGILGGHTSRKTLMQIPRCQWWRVMATTSSLLLPLFQHHLCASATIDPCLTKKPYNSRAPGNIRRPFSSSNLISLCVFLRAFIEPSGIKSWMK